MKKIILIILSAALVMSMCLSLVSCGSTEEKEYAKAISLLENGEYEQAKALFEKLGDYADSKDYLKNFYYMPTAFKYNLTDKVGSFDIEYNKNNLPSKESTARDEMYSVCEFVYNENGDIIKQIANKNGIIYTYDYTYNPDGTRNSAIYTAPDGIGATHRFTYDENGRLLRETYEDASGVELYSCEYTYDEKGNAIAQDVVEGELAYRLEIEFVYDANGKLTREVCDYGEGVQELLDYTYDENGNMIKKVFTSYDGSQICYEYTYSADGNVIKEVLTDAQGTVQYVEIEYKLMYIPNGLTAPTELFFSEYWSSML